MKVPVSWLQEHLNTSCDVASLTLALGRLGLVVDAIHQPGLKLQTFKIVEILETFPHPQADRLKVCRVSTGTEILQIVCADPKVRPGMKSVLGRPGDYVPGLDVTLKDATIRGIDSQGMLCTLKELGLAEESEGIIDLPSEAPVGATYVAYEGLDDPILDVDITPNRGDCLGMYGIARDLYAAGIGTFKPLQAVDISASYDCPLKIQQDLETTDACPYFTGRLIRGVKNGESPLWLQKKLKAVGLKPISTLVDITNFMAYDLGRPMHVFDADRLKGDLRLRFAQDDESIQALDGQTYTLKPPMLVVADDAGPLAIGGIMGGQDSGCQLDTTMVFLESAYFHPQSIARTGRALGIISDSRHRFERGVDPALVDIALDKATQMILDLCGGQASQTVHVGQLPTPQITLDFDPKMLESFGGLKIETSEIIGILQRLGFTCQEHTSILKVSVPTWRSDIEGSHDLVEEILRIKGYEAIPVVPLPSPTPEEAFPLSSTLQTRRERQWIARRVLAARGLSEVFTWSFMKEEEATCFAQGAPLLTLTNPISNDLSTMRPSLIGPLAKCIQRNKDRGTLSVGLFEVALDYQNITETGQRWVVAGIRSGYYTQRHWHKAIKNGSIYDAKADVIALLEAFGINHEKVQFVPQGPAYYHPGQCTSLTIDSQVVGYIGTLHPTVEEALGLEGPLYAFELFLEALPLSETQSLPYMSISLQPVERDLAFVVDETIHADVLLKALRQVDPDLIVAADIFDVYRGKGVPEGKKSVALWYRMQPRHQTLTDAQIHETMQAVIHAIEQATKGLLRQ